MPFSLAAQQSSVMPDAPFADVLRLQRRAVVRALAVPLAGAPGALVHVTSRVPVCAEP